MKIRGKINSGTNLLNFSDRTAADSSISEKVIKGSFWVLALRLTSRLLGILRTFILARMLLPADFGLIGVATITISLIETFSQPGIGAALIQKKEKIEPYLDTIWTVSIVRSIIIYALLFVAAPYVSDFFKAPEASGIIQVFGVSVIIAGCRNSGVVFFQKSLNFKKQYIYELSILLGNIFVAIPAALILGNVWALVLGGLAGSIMRFVMSYALHPFRPRFRFDTRKFSELFRYGRWVLGSSILVFLISQGDDIFFGKMFGVTALGFYQMAYMISNLPTTETSRVIAHVTFPAYSELQDDNRRISSAYLKILQMVFFIAIPLAGAIFVFASDAISIFLSNRWLPVVPLLQLLVWSGLAQAMVDATGAVFNACGKPSINTKWQLINLVVLITSIYPLSRVFGVTGVVIAVLLANITAALVSIYEVRKVLQFRLLKFLKIFFIPLIGMLACVAVVRNLRTLLEFDKNMELILLLAVGAVLYYIITFCFDWASNYNMRNMIRETVRLLRAGYS